MPGCIDKRKKTILRVGLFFTIVIGWGSLVLTLVFFYHGALEFIDLGFSPAAVLVLNAVLSMLFFIQHSWTIRPSFRKRIEQCVNPEYHAALYTVSSGIVLFMVFYLWQRSPIDLLNMEGTGRWLFRGGFFASLAGFYWGVRSLDRFDALGIVPLMRELKGKPAMSHKKKTLSEKGAYRFVRHPLYFFSILLIWSCPDISADRLLFNVLWTLWIIIGTVLEDRDLVMYFGDDYRLYQKRVPMLIPWKIIS